MHSKYDGVMDPHSKCTICLSKDRPKINESLIQIGIRPTQRKWPTFNLATLWNHARNHLPETIVKLREWRATHEMKLVAERVEDLLMKTETIYEAAKNKEDLGMALASVKELRGSLELLAKLTGELQPTGIQVNQQVNQVVVQGDTLERIRQISARVRARLPERVQAAQPPMIEGMDQTN